LKPRAGASAPSGVENVVTFYACFKKQSINQNSGQIIVSDIYYRTTILRKGQIMDNLKDTEIKGQNSPVKAGTGFYSYVFLKSEKIASALYIITNFISDEEPLKWQLRRQVLNLVDLANNLLKDKNGFLGLTYQEKITEKINDLVVLLGIAEVGGAVSKMNLSILREECLALANEIAAKINENNLKSSLFEAKIAALPIPIPMEREHDSLSSRKDESNLALSSKKALQTVSRFKGLKDIANELHGLNHQDNKKLLRRERIINFLRHKDWISIAEIATALSDCGVKTVQRELLGMVEQGVLRKQGERRWSRYMLAS